VCADVPTARVLFPLSCDHCVCVISHSRVPTCACVINVTLTCAHVRMCHLCHTYVCPLAHVSFHTYVCPLAHVSIHAHMCHSSSCRTLRVSSQPFLDACADIIPFFDALGSTAFKPVKMDIAGNISVRGGASLVLLVSCSLCATARAAPHRHIRSFFSIPDATWQRWWLRAETVVHRVRATNQPVRSADTLERTNAHNPARAPLITLIPLMHCLRAATVCGHCRAWRGGGGGGG
jgi:hypothetical protein